MMRIASSERQNTVRPSQVIIRSGMMDEEKKVVSARLIFLRNVHRDLEQSRAACSVCQDRIEPELQDLDDRGRIAFADFCIGGYRSPPVDQVSICSTFTGKLMVENVFIIE